MGALQPHLARGSEVIFRKPLDPHRTGLQEGKGREAELITGPHEAARSKPRCGGSESVRLGGESRPGERASGIHSSPLNTWLCLSCVRHNVTVTQQRNCFPGLWEPEERAVGPSSAKIWNP